MPFQGAERRAHLGEWGAEREANEARQWLAEHGRGATTEAEFLEQWGNDVYSHLRSKGSEGERLVKAMARRIWVREQARIAEWEAFVEEKAAEEAFQAFEDEMRQRRVVAA